VQRDLSRRSFVRGSALTAVGASMASATAAAMAQTQADKSSANEVQPISITLKVNGAPQALRVEPRMTLAEALRGPMGLTGTKIACNRGACSACTVWLDGLPICSCMMLAVDVGERSILGPATSETP